MLFRSVVKKLVEAGAFIKDEFFPPDFVFCTEDSPLQEACMKDHWKIVEYLMDHGAGVDPPVVGGASRYFTPISCAASHSLKMVKRMLALGADINSDRDDHCGTALMRAVMAGKREIVEYLLRKGVRVNAFTNNGYSALELANQSSQKSKKQIIQLLQKRHAKTYRDLAEKYPYIHHGFGWPPPHVPE